MVSTPQYAELYIGMDLQGRKSNKLPYRDIYSVEVNLLLKFICTRKSNLCGLMKQDMAREITSESLVMP